MSDEESQRFKSAGLRVIYCANAAFAVLPWIPSAYPAVRSLAVRVFALLPAIQRMLAVGPADVTTCDVLEVAADLIGELAGICQTCSLSLSESVPQAASVQELSEKVEWAVRKLGWTVPSPRIGCMRLRYTDARAVAAATASKMGEASERVKILCVCPPSGQGATAFCRAVAQKLHSSKLVDKVVGVRWTGCHHAPLAVLLKATRGEGLLAPESNPRQRSAAYAHCFENTRTCVVITGVPASVLPASIVGGRLPQAPEVRGSGAGVVAGSVLQGLVPSLPAVSVSARTARVYLLVAVTSEVSEPEEPPPASPSLASSAAVSCWSCSPPELTQSGCASVAASELIELLRSPSSTVQLRKDVIALAETRWERKPWLVSLGARVLHTLDRSRLLPEVSSLLRPSLEHPLADLLALTPDTPIPVGAGEHARRPDLLLGVCVHLYGSECFTTAGLATVLSVPVTAVYAALHQLAAVSLVTSDTESSSDPAEQWSRQYRVRGGVVEFASTTLVGKVKAAGVDLRRLVGRHVIQQGAEVHAVKQEILLGNISEGVCRYDATMQSVKRVLDQSLFDDAAPDQVVFVAWKLLLDALRIEGSFAGLPPHILAGVAIAVDKA
eukprot:Hpha_TRINITY_DN26606_c0_g1::TRINITY_DN26606_c0_g1_i1::g.86068::m.86068